MLPVILAVVLGAGGTGSSPPRAVYGFMGGDFTASTAVAAPRATLLAPAPGTLTRLHWEATAAGTDDGEGPDSFTLAVTVDGIASCSATIDCTTTSGGTATCSGEFTSDQDLHLEVTASACATLPAFVAGATWRQ